MEQEFSGRHVLVTGAAAGIGRAIALAFAAEGANVSAIDINADGLARLANNIDGLTILPCDISDPEAARTALETAEADAGPVTILVNNAGVDQRYPIGDLTDALWRQMLAVNLDHHFVLSQRAARSMKTAGGGAIVNLSSTAWMKSAANLTAYHAAKAGVIGLTRGLARELGPAGIRVNAVAPGRVVTERVEAAITDEWISETHALQCLPELIRPRDIADAVLFLASDRARMITAQTLIVDGGVV